MFICHRSASWSLVAATVALAGCDKQPVVDNREALVVERTPEALLENIVVSLKRHVEDKSLGDASAIAGYDADPGTPVTDATTRVSHELIAPAGEGEPYRATVSLTTKSTVTMVLPPKAEEEGPGADPTLEGLEENIEGLPPLKSLVVPSTDSIGRVGGSPIQTLPDEQVSVYELEFRDKRWVLLTELDREKEPFSALAIEYALKRQ